jgi:hypothetical protein
MAGPVVLQQDEVLAAETGAFHRSGEHSAVTVMYLCIEAVGCPTVCRHCWAQGRPYRAMPVQDIAWVLEQAHQFCEDRGLAFDAYPMHELAAHPDAARLFGLFNDHSASAKGESLFEPLPTTGVPLASREDWPQVLEAAADTGTSTVWVAFHGLGEEHDRQVNRRGAFAETCLAIDRIHAMGLRVGCNVFVTTANLPQLDQLVATLAGLPIDAGMSWETANFLPTPRSRRNERLRPSLPELLPVAAQILELTAPIHCEVWANLAAHTEAAYVGRAVAGGWPAAPKRPDGELAFVCRPNLEVWTGLAGRYRTRHGNLRTDGVEAVLDRALAHGVRTDEALWFSLDPLPAPAEAAACHGDPAGLGIHLSSQSAYYLWLDRAARAGPAA